jgi:hypothetical protein
VKLLKRIFVLFVVLFACTYIAQAQNYTTVTASNIGNGSGSNLANGTICFQATDTLDRPVAFSINGTRQATLVPVCATVSNGAITGPIVNGTATTGTFQIANPSNTIPAGVNYRITVTDTDAGTIVTTYKNVILTGGTFSYDGFVANSTSMNNTGLSWNAAATINLGSVTTLPAGSQAVVTNSGNSTQAVFNFQLPQGATGPSTNVSIGTVTTGAPGSNAGASMTGSSPSQTLNLTIPQGPVGPTGATGPANTLSVAATNTLPPGNNATVSISGAAPSQQITFGIPAGVSPTFAVGAVNTTGGTQPTVTITGSSPNYTLNFTVPSGSAGNDSLAVHTNVVTQQSLAGALALTEVPTMLQVADVTHPNFGIGSPLGPITFSGSTTCSSNPSITASAPGTTYGVTATIQGYCFLGQVGYVYKNAGAGYLTPGTLTVSGGGTSGTSATAVLLGTPGVADPTGTHDSTAAIGNAADWVMTSPVGTHTVSEVYLPSGIYQVSGEIYANCYVRFRGAGKADTTVELMTNTQTGFFINGLTAPPTLNGWECLGGLYDFTIHAANGHSFTGNLVELAQVAGYTIEGMKFDNSGGRAVQSNNSERTKWFNNEFDSNRLNIIINGGNENRLVMTNINAAGQDQGGFAECQRNCFYGVIPSNVPTDAHFNLISASGNGTTATYVFSGSVPSGIVTGSYFVAQNITGTTALNGSYQITNIQANTPTSGQTTLTVNSTVNGTGTMSSSAIRFQDVLVSATANGSYGTVVIQGGVDTLASNGQSPMVGGHTFELSNISDATTLNGYWTVSDSGPLSVVSASSTGGVATYVVTGSVPAWFTTGFQFVVQNVSDSGDSNNNLDGFWSVTSIQANTPTSGEFTITASNSHAETGVIASNSTIDLMGYSNNTPTSSQITYVFPTTVSATTSNSSGIFQIAILPEWASQVTVSGASPMILGGSWKVDWYENCINALGTYGGTEQGIYCEGASPNNRPVMNSSALIGGGVPQWTQQNGTLANGIMPVASTAWFENNVNNPADAPLEPTATVIILPCDFVLGDTTDASSCNPTVKKGQIEEATVIPLSNNTIALVGRNQSGSTAPSNTVWVNAIVAEQVQSTSFGSFTITDQRMTAMAVPAFNSLWTTECVDGTVNTCAIVKVGGIPNGYSSFTDGQQHGSGTWGKANGSATLIDLQWTTPTTIPTGFTAEQIGGNYVKVFGEDSRVTVSNAGAWGIGGGEGNEVTNGGFTSSAVYDVVAVTYPQDSSIAGVNFVDTSNDTYVNNTIGATNQAAYFNRFYALSTDSVLGANPGSPNEAFGFQYTNSICYDDTPLSTGTHSLNRVCFKGGPTNTGGSAGFEVDYYNGTSWTTMFSCAPNTALTAGTCTIASGTTLQMNGSLSGLSTLTGQAIVLTAQGSASAPSVEFDNSASYGMYWNNSASAWDMVFNGNDRFAFNGSELTLASGMFLCWNSNGTNGTLSDDTGIGRNNAAEIFFGACSSGSTTAQLDFTRSKYTNSAAPSGVSGFSFMYSDSTTLRMGEVAGTGSALPVAEVVASGTVTLGTAAISSAACATAVTGTASLGSVSNVATTNTVKWSYSGDPTSVTGFAPSATGVLRIVAYPTAGAVNFKVCNDTSGSITPGSALTLNWIVEK